MVSPCGGVGLPWDVTGSKTGGVDRKGVCPALRLDNGSRMDVEGNGSLDGEIYLFPQTVTH